MLWKIRGSFFRTLVFRATLWYAALFGVSSICVFMVVYLFLVSGLEHTTNKTLLDSSQEFLAHYNANGAAALQEEFRREAHSRGVGRVFFRLLSRQGNPLAFSDPLAWQGIEIPAPSDLEPGEANARFETIKLPRHRGRVRVLSIRAPDGRIMQLGTTLHDNDMFAEDYRETFGTALMVILFCGGVLGWIVSKRAVSGLDRLRQTAARIGKDDLGRRVPIGREGEEIDSLGIAFNKMLDRIQALVTELEEVTNSVAHDLRSPLTRIRGIAETTLISGSDLDAYREMAGVVIEESDRLVGMINTMLEIARTETGLEQLSQTTLDMRIIAEEAVELFLPSAEDKGLTVDVDMAGEPLPVLGDRVRLQRAMANLLDNAIKYTGPGGRIFVSARASGSKVTVQVKDTGVGISEIDLPYVFNRFYRAERSRSTPGSGLGLALARSNVRAHRGEIELASAPSQGSTFTIILPCAPSI
jgi:signal transduction histidine kinase